MVRQAVDDLRAGGQLVMFPEGTRTTGASLNPFHGGFALIARARHAPVQTVFIDTTSPYLGKGWPIWKRAAAADRVLAAHRPAFRARARSSTPG